jgi:hypothetical protein
MTNQQKFCRKLLTETKERQVRREGKKKVEECKWKRAKDKFKKSLKSRRFLVV